MLSPMVPKRVVDEAVSPLCKSAQLPEALRHFEQGLAVCREIGDRKGEAVTSWNLGLEYERRGDLARALLLFESSVRTKEALKHPDLERDQAYLATLKEGMREPGAEPSSSGVEPMIPRTDPK